ncbi:methyltransferase domain-containing protein [Nioella aestuarii]|uniref:methyltransferase domain-containing protein n=1 Tax=Nioella aestuarii TaxID=1662864 RepID=UPI003D7F309E
MSRKEYLLKYAKTSGRGMEVAPYFNPTLKKSDGFDILTLDVFNSQELRERATQDENIDAASVLEIEDVDLVGDASRLGEIIKEQGLEGQFDYVISSHNFEHLPNPILFLQGVSVALKPGGILSMALPDCRACFDHYRMPTRLVDWLRAYHEEHKQPTPETIFDSSVNFANYMRGGVEKLGMHVGKDSLNNFRPTERVRASYAAYLENRATPGPYQDSHCSVFFAESLELMLLDLRHLGLIDLNTIETIPTNGLEFYIHLRKSDNVNEEQIDDSEFYIRRAALMNLVVENLGNPGIRNIQGNSGKAILARSFRKVESGARMLNSKILGNERAKKIDQWWRSKRKRRSN